MIEKQKETYILSNKENERIYVKIYKGGKMSVMPYFCYKFLFEKSDPERVKRIAKLIEEASKIKSELL